MQVDPDSAGHAYATPRAGEAPPPGPPPPPPPPPGPPPDSARYLGLLPRWAVISVVIAAIAVGAASLIPAWSQAREVGESLQSRVEELAKARPGESPERTEVRDANVAILATLSNHQSLALLAIASGYFLFALSFALFLLGIEGRVRIEADGPVARGRLNSSGAAPGIAALAAGTVLVAIGATRNYDIKPNLSPAPVVFDMRPAAPSQPDPVAAAKATYPER